MTTANPKLHPPANGQMFLQHPLTSSDKMKRALQCEKEATKRKICTILAILMAAASVTTMATTHELSLYREQQQQVKSVRRLRESPQVHLLDVNQVGSPSLGVGSKADAKEQQATKPPSVRTLPSNKLYMTSTGMRQLMQHNTPQSFLRNPHKFWPSDMEIHVFNHSSMRQSVQLIGKELEQESSVTGAWEAFSLSTSWTDKADLWRYMILWSQGGVYLDGHLRLQAPIEEWATLKPHETASLCTDHIGQWKPVDMTHNYTPLFWNGVLSARKRSPILLEAIRITIANMQQQQQQSSKPRMTASQVLGWAATSPHVPPNSYRADIKYLMNLGVFLKSQLRHRFAHADNGGLSPIIVLDQEPDLEFGVQE